MRAIFLIPTSPAPTLPEPNKWSDKFKSFLAACLQKNPNARPDAATLLATHPFITGAGGKEVIAALVKECAIKRVHQKRDNIKTLTMRLQTERAPLEDGGTSETVRRRTELQEGEPNFDDSIQKTKPYLEPPKAQEKSKEKQGPGGEKEEDDGDPLFQISYT
eukprot:TRINITY_DN5820_c0_g1_i5.p1 TRINITY_DN5820_c0_g1~~TRINITY_DN5820_c0_g1_i5.p1  ORF type:complete len:162 (-),score=34.54 TRINITY_DN5820_c0_g1_i5:327-812(-)